MRRKIEDMIPTLEEVREYVSSLHTYYTPELFYNYYQAIGWKFNRRRIYDWKAVARFWADNKTNRALIINETQKVVDNQQRIAEERERQQAERNERLAQQKAQAVSYEQYLSMKADGRV